jgi:hypothetical protein
MHKQAASCEGTATFDPRREDRLAAVKPQLDSLKGLPEYELIHVESAALAGL